MATMYLLNGAGSATSITQGQNGLGTFSNGVKQKGGGVGNVLPALLAPVDLGSGLPDLER